MSAAVRPVFTPQEYLDIERAAEHRSEFFAGEIFALAGASAPHNFITLSVGSALLTRLRGGKCRTMLQDMRVKVDPSGLYTYPDVVVVCGEPRFEDEHLDTLLNPTLIIEVLSPSTEGYDRGGKFANYRRVESLQQYVLISQDRRLVEVFTRAEAGEWRLTEAGGAGAVARLESINCELPLDEVYENVDFFPRSPHPDPTIPR